MKLSGWVRLWIVASVIWWGVGGMWVAQNVPASWTPTNPGAPLQDARWEMNYGPVIVTALIVALVPFGVALAFVAVRWVLRWIWRGFRPSAR